MADTRIEWATKVWNPVTGCTKVSAGCKYCYAERIATRFWGDRAFGDVRLHPDRLDHPLRWRKPQRIFVNSMSDLFHLDVPFWFVANIMHTIWRSPQHSFQILTKRPKRMLQWSEWAGNNIAPNVHLYVSCEYQTTADERIPLLLQTPAAVRGVSLEPLLGPVDVSDYLTPIDPCLEWPNGRTSLNHVIVGGETGPGARPCNVEWIRSIVEQCKEAGVPVFVKQLGAQPKGWCSTLLIDGAIGHDVPDFATPGNLERGAAASIGVGI